jgi:hypothetical protein
MYMDTSNSFSPGRIATMIDEFPISLVREVDSHTYFCTYLSFRVSVIT